jgi:anionic cell wall polymer biosynthesis LytR-Cps2A-Psr (LCP) family protein
LEYVRHRKGLPDNIFDRDQRQQNFLRAVFEKIVQPSVLANPVRLTNLLESFSSVMAVDDTLTPSVIRSLALQSRGLRSSFVRFVTAPYLGNPKIDGEYVVKLDRPLVEEMFAAIDSDRFETWFAENPVPTLPAPGSVP